MATFTATLSITVNVSVDIDDRNLTKCLKTNAIEDYIDVNFGTEHRPKDLISNRNAEIDFSIDDIEYSDITKQNKDGDDIDYDWDGEKLTKAS